MKETNYRIFNNSHLMPPRKADGKIRKEKRVTGTPPEEADLEVLWHAQRDWDILNKHRRRRSRSAHYTFCNPWMHTNERPVGRRLSERDSNTIQQYTTVHYVHVHHYDVTVHRKLRPW